MSRYSPQLKLLLKRIQPTNSEDIQRQVNTGYSFVSKVYKYQWGSHKMSVLKEDRYLLVNSDIISHGWIQILKPSVKWSFWLFFEATTKSMKRVIYKV